MLVEIVLLLVAVRVDPTDPDPEVIRAVEVTDEDIEVEVVVVGSTVSESSCKNMIVIGSPSYFWHI